MTNQNKHIDEIVDQFSVHQPRGRAKGTVARRSLKKKLAKQLATEQLAIWNKALELVGEDEPLEGLTGTIKTAYNNQNFVKQRLRSAIQQQIDKIGGK